MAQGLMAASSRVTVAPHAEAAWIRGLWPGLRAHQINEQQYAALLQHVFSRIRGMDFLCLDACPIQNLGDALQVLSRFSRDPDLTPDRAAHLIVSSFATDTDNIPAATARYSDTVWRCVELVASLWSNVDVRIPKGVSRGFSSPCVWDGDKTFQKFLDDEFDRKRRYGCQAMVDHHGIKQLEQCTMARLIERHGLQVCWTSNLAEHLKISAHSKPKTVTFYEHKIWLWNHFQASTKDPSSPHRSVVPPAAIEEALDTHNLLFPFGDPATARLLKREGKEATIYGLGSCGRRQKVNLEHYEYWRQEISDLLDILSQTPSGKAQLFADKDGKNLLQIWTFWTAIAFGLLAVAGVVTGIYSAVYANMSYQLALAQACSAENATDLLPTFCR